MSCLVIVTVLLTVLLAGDGRSMEIQTENVIGSQQAEAVTPSAAGWGIFKILFSQIEYFSTIHFFR